MVDSQQGVEVAWVVEVEMAMWARTWVGTLVAAPVSALGGVAVVVVVVRFAAQALVLAPRTEVAMMALVLVV